VREPIPGFDGYYAGDDGSIWSKWRLQGKGYGRKGEWKISDKHWYKLTPDCRKSDDRKRYTLRTESGKYVKRYGSNLVLLAFVGPRPAGMEACHNNGDCTNDAVTNVRWDTPEANKADMIRHGATMRGEKSATAKLDWAKVRGIRRAFASGEKRKFELAIENNVSRTLIGYIIKGTIWKETN
jgi:hypothetical protein